MIAPGNKNMASVGDRNYPAADLPNVIAYRKDAASKGKDTALRNLARKRITYGKRPPRQDFMPKPVRKVTDPVSQFAGAAGALGSNIDIILRGISGKRVGLPKLVKKGLNIL